MTYFFETYGCQMNIAESASIEQLFISRGWEKSEYAEYADIVVINTCSVRATAENRIFGRLGWYAGLKAVRACHPEAKNKSLEKAAEYVKDGAKPLTLVVTGCMAERLLESLKKDHPFIDYVVGTYAKKNFGKIIDEVEGKLDPTLIDDSEKYKFAAVSYEPGSFSSYVPIMHGCNNFCSYCIVPYVRGRETSRSIDEIISEIDVLSKYNVREICLLGQNVNSYNYNGVDFAELLKRIENRIKETDSSIGWVRFMSSHPKDLSDSVIDVISKSKIICHHIHLPVQHGSSRILSDMNRKYTREQYLETIAKIKKAIPDVSLTTDIMMGFPGETDEDVEETLSLMKEVRYENAFMYYYNVREGTPAAKMKNQIPVKIRKERLQKVIDLQLKITASEMEKRKGSVEKVLVESVSRDNKEELLGKTERDERVAFKASKELIGKFATVKIYELSGNTFRGSLFEK